MKFFKLSVELESFVQYPAKKNTSTKANEKL